MNKNFGASGGFHEEIKYAMKIIQNGYSLWMMIQFRKRGL